METVRVQQNSRERIEAYFQNTATTPLSGLTPTLTIRRQSDGFFWTTGSSFTSVFSQVNMSAVDALNQGGYYSYLFDTTSLADDTYSLISSGTGASNSPSLGELKVGGFVDSIDASIQAISNTMGAGTVVHLKGVFTKEEKERLIRLIADNFKQLFDLIQIVIRFHESTSQEQKLEFERLERKIRELSGYLEAQVDLIKQIDESNQLHEEIYTNG